MKTLKKVTALVCATLMAASLAACGSGNKAESGANAAGSADTPAKSESSGEAVYKWKAANVLADGGAWAAGLDEFAKLLNEKSNGQIELSVYNGGQLGQERDTIEGLNLGTCDFVICSSATLSNFTDTQNIWDLPFLFTSVDAARGVLDSEVGTECLAALSDVGIKGLSYWENGMYVLGSTKPIEKPGDLKGLKVRTIESNLQADLYSCFDATAVVIPWGDVYTSLQQGACDVTTTTAPNMYSAKQHEVAKYITQAGQIYGPAPLLMSQSTWESLPEEIQKIVQEAADEAKIAERAAVDKALEDAKITMESEGCTFYEIDANEWAEYVQPVYDKYVGTMGIEEDMVNAVKEKAKEF